MNTPQMLLRDVLFSWHDAKKESKKEPLRTTKKNIKSKIYTNNSNKQEQGMMMVNR
eukprot:m.103380 g.103380  ORF g.103380 m.103380 type:complete len:56 (+) comp15042_c1_seq1:154-321(+)